MIFYEIANARLQKQNYSRSFKMENCFDIFRFNVRNEVRSTEGIMLNRIPDKQFPTRFPGMRGDHGNEVGFACPVP